MRRERTLWLLVLLLCVFVFGSFQSMAQEGDEATPVADVQADVGTEAEAQTLNEVTGSERVVVQEVTTPDEAQGSIADTVTTAETVAADAFPLRDFLILIAFIVVSGGVLYAIHQSVPASTANLLVQLVEGTAKSTYNTAVQKVDRLVSQTPSKTDDEVWAAFKSIAQMRKDANGNYVISFGETAPNSSSDVSVISDADGNYVISLNETPPRIPISE